MDELTAKAAAWLQSVVRRLPNTIRALYVEYGDAYTPDMDHEVYFNAFGFEALAGGRFDPSNADHVGELGEFTWESPDACSFRADEHPGLDWMTVLRSAARSPEARGLVAGRGLQFVIGEHDGEVCVIR